MALALAGIAAIWGPSLVDLARDLWGSDRAATAPAPQQRPPVDKDLL